MMRDNLNEFLGNFKQKFDNKVYTAVENQKNQN